MGAAAVAVAVEAAAAANRSLAADHALPTHATAGAYHRFRTPHLPLNAIVNTSLGLQWPSRPPKIPQKL